MANPSIIAIDNYWQSVDNPLIIHWSWLNNPLIMAKSINGSVIELDDGNIETGTPFFFDGKNPWVSGEDFPVKTNPSMDIHGLPYRQGRRRNRKRRAPRPNLRPPRRRRASCHKAWHAMGPVGPGGPRWALWHLWRVILGRFFWGEKLVFYQEIWGTHGFLWWNMVLLGGYMRKCKEIWGNTGLNGRKEGLRWWFEWISNDENWLFRMKYDHVWWWWWWWWW